MDRIIWNIVGCWSNVSLWIDSLISDVQISIVLSFARTENRQMDAFPTHYHQNAIRQCMQKNNDTENSSILIMIQPDINMYSDRRHGQTWFLAFILLIIKYTWNGIFANDMQYLCIFDDRPGLIWTPSDGDCSNYLGVFSLGLPTSEIIDSEPKQYLANCFFKITTGYVIVWYG